jgi:hypothetical protein
LAHSFEVEQMESVTDLVEVQERAADVPEDSECAMSEGDRKGMQHSAHVLCELCEAANLRRKSQGLDPLPDLPDNDSNSQYEIIEIRVEW